LPSTLVAFFNRKPTAIDFSIKHKADPQNHICYLGEHKACPTKPTIKSVDFDINLNRVAKNFGSKNSHPTLIKNRIWH
jgi:hypothetical protein